VDNIGAFEEAVEKRDKAHLELSRACMYLVAHRHNYAIKGNLISLYGELKTGKHFDPNFNVYVEDNND